MKEKISSHLISALLGGTVSAIIVLLATGQMPTVFTFSETAHAQIGQEIVPDTVDGKVKRLEVESLTVGDIFVSKEAIILGEEGKPAAILKGGYITAENAVVAKKLAGGQIQGHAIVANRMLITPDDTMKVPTDQWRFFTEIGSSVEGGEVLIRSADGAALPGKATKGGTLLRAGFETESQPQIVAIQNEKRQTVPINFELSEKQMQILKGITDL